MPDTNTLYNEACNYYNGKNGYPLNKKKAFSGFLEAAKAGVPQAMYSVAYMYANGECVPQDLKKAFLLYERAAAAGVISANVALGKMYYNGEYVHQNMNEAYKHYSYAATKGDGNAAYMSGCIALYTFNDYNLAFTYFCTAAKNNIPNAYHNLGYICESRKGPHPDDKTAAGFYEKAAAMGVVESMCALGKIYYRNQLQKDGIYWISKAANLGYEPAKKLLKLFKASNIVSMF